MHPELKKAISRYEDSSGEETEYDESLKDIQIFFSSEIDYKSEIDQLLVLFEDHDEFYLDYVLESLLKNYEQNKVILLYTLQKIFERSLKNDDFHLLEYIEFYETEITLSENKEFAQDVFNLALPYAENENLFVFSSSIYLITSSFEYLNTSQKFKATACFDHILKGKNWRKRFMAYSYLKLNKINDYNISFVDKLRGALIKIPEML